MKFLSGCFGKALLVIFCILLGVVLTLGGIAGAGYFALMTKGMVGTVADKANQSGAITLDFSDEVREMSIYDWAQNLLRMATNLTSENGPTIGEFEKYIGINLISSQLAQFLHLDPEIIESSSLTGENGIASVITSELTMNKVMEMIGEDIMPDMPMFEENSEFMNKPIKEAFSNLTDYTIGDFVAIDENSPKILKALSKVKISEVSEKIPTIPIGDLIDQQEDSHPVIAAISHLTISDLGTSKLTDAVNGMKLSEILTNMTEDDTNKVLYSLKDLTVGELAGTETNDRVNSMFLGEIIDITESSNQTLKSLQYACISSQFITLVDPVKEGGYATVTGDLMKILKSNSSTHTYDLAYYPEVIKYPAEKSEGVPVKNIRNQYGVRYETYVPTTSITSRNDVKIGGVTFTPVQDEDGHNVTKNEDTLVSAVLYLGGTARLSADQNTVRVNNRYHAFYNENGDLAFFNCDDETPLGCIELTEDEVIAATVDTDNKTLVTYAKYKVGADDTTYHENKAVKTARQVTVGEKRYDLYEFHPLVGINEKMNELTLGDVMTVSPSSPPIIKSLEHTKVTEMGNVIDTMPLRDVMTINESSSRIMKSLADTPLNAMSEKIDTLFIDEIVEINDDSSQMIRSLRYTTLESRIEYIDATTLSSSSSATATDIDAYRTAEVDFYANAALGNRYYYKIDPATNTVQSVYVLYLDKNDHTKVNELSRTAFYQTKNHPDRVDLDFSLAGKTSTPNTTIGYNLTILTALDPDPAVESFYYRVGLDEKITNIYQEVEIDGKPALQEITSARVPIGEPYYIVLSGDDPIFTYDTDGITPLSMKCYQLFNRYRPMMGLSDKTNEMTIADVFSQEKMESGVLSLVDKETRLTDISDEVADAVQNSTVALLSDTGVITSSSFDKSSFKNLQPERKCFIYDSTLSDMLDGVIDFINDPIDKSNPNPLNWAIKYGTVSPHAITVNTVNNNEFDSLTHFVNTICATSPLQYAELDFAKNATVTVDPVADSRWFVDTDGNGEPDSYVIPIFNIKADSLCGVTFVGADVYVGVYDYNETSHEYDNYAKHQVAYYYDPTFSLSTVSAKIVKLHSSKNNKSISASSFASLSALTAAYSQDNLITFTGGAVTVTVDPLLDDTKFGVDENNDTVIDYYAIPVFSIAGTNGISFTDGVNPADVRIAVYYKVNSSDSDAVLNPVQKATYSDTTNSLTPIDIGIVKISE